MNFNFLSKPCQTKALCAVVSLGFIWFAIPRPASAQTEISYHPLGGWRTVTSHFGYRNNPFDGRKQFHRGIDLDVQVGDSVFAWRRGIVLFTGYNRLSGNMINLQHSNDYISKYHHLSRILVKEGQLVEAGQLIGLAGKSGRVTGSHLHFSILRNGEHLDPYDYLKQAANIPATIPETHRTEIMVYKEFSIQTIPPNGEVYIDGEYFGNAPLNVKLPYGEHFVEIGPGSPYTRYVERIWIDQRVFRLHNLHLQIEELPAVARLGTNGDSGIPAGAYLPYNRKGKWGIVVHLNLISPEDDFLSDGVEDLHSFDAGLGKYISFPRFLIPTHLIDLRFNYTFGDLRSNVNSPPPPGRSNEFEILAVALGYYLSPGISSRFGLLAGGELSLGTLKTIRFLENGSPPPPENTTVEGNFLQSSEKSAYFAAALSLGAILHWTDHLAVTGKYYQTFLATDTRWRGVKIGLMFVIGN